MPARWDIAAVIIAFITVFVSASPAAIAILQQSFRRLYCLVLPARGQCLRLLWSDIQEGLLHHCDPRNCSQTNHQSTKPHDTVNCWVDTLGRVFNRTWYFMNSDSNVTKYITKKPNGLPLGKEYIQTDIQTLKAFLLLTADVCHSCETVDAVGLLEIQRRRGLITIHLPLSGPMPVNTQLTKVEINRIIEGYPPFCREKFTTTGGITLLFPTTKTDHIGQGGWILSVGMSVTIGPTPSLHNMQRVTHERPDAYWRGTLVLTAFHMIGRTLAQLKTYEDSQHEHPRSNPSKRAWSQDALTCFQMIMAPGYSIQPWALKEEQIERSDLFKSIMGECLCYSTCIGNLNHSV